jgi:murein peptide amidase A
VSRVPFWSDDGALASAWRAVRATHGLRLREIACVGAPRTLLVAECGDPAAPCISISAGAHGDEPAALAALYVIVRDRLLDPAFGYRLGPCFNPTGFAAGTRTNVDGVDVNRSFGRGGTSPEARAVLTANRDFRFALSIDLHEDYEASGFYLYEQLRAGAQSRFARPVADAVTEAGFPVQRDWTGFELGPPGSEAAQTLVPGAVVVDAPRETPTFGGALPLGLVLLRRAADHALTFESPRGRAWDDRIAIHRVAVVAAIAQLRGAR